MAMSAAERKRVSRQRQREAQRRAGDQAEAFLKTPFFEIAHDDPNWDDIDLTFDLMGIEPPTFRDDAGPKSFNGDIDDDAYESFPANSLGRAEVMVGSLLDAAQALAKVINNYKTAEIDARIAEIEASDLSDPEQRKQALEDIVQLRKIRERLTKEVRRSMPVWSIKE